MWETARGKVRASHRGCQLKRLHVGSGSVYLRDWINVDVKGPRTFLASNRPDLVEKFGTTDDQYYARHQDKTIDTVRQGPLDQDYVCDAYGSFGNLPLPYWEIDEVLARHAFEHLSFNEARSALDMLDSVMKVGAVLRLDVPDHEETVRLLQETRDPFYARHLLGPRRDQYGYHMRSYTRQGLIDLVEDHGFSYICEEPNIHFYPAFCLRFHKLDLMAARDYVKLPYSIEDHWKVLEIGPGANPFSRADVVVDCNPAHLEPLTAKRTVCADLEQGLPELGDKEFDYLFCAHVLEHVQDPIACARTMSRIAKRGTAVFPSVMKESLFNFEEAAHRWLILPHPNGGPPVFVRRNGDIERLKDAEVMGSMCRLFRTGPNRMGEESRHLRRWFREKEPLLDVVCHWQDKLELMVIQ